MTIEPISEIALYDVLHQAEADLRPRTKRLWELVSIPPQLWRLNRNGDETRVWTLAVIGRDAIWYNHIEEGFGIKSYETWGQLGEYQDVDLSLHYVLEQILRIIEGELKYSSGDG